MEKIKAFLNDYNFIEYAINDDNLTFKSYSDNITLNGSYSNNKLVVELVGHNGNIIYSFSDFIDDEDLVISKISEVINMFNTVTSIQSDLKRRDTGKRILLDATDVDDSNITNSDATETLQVIRDSLIELANSNSSLVDKFDSDNLEYRLIASGLLSSIYAVAQNFDDLIVFMSNSNSSMTNESVSVAPKVDYMSLAKDGLDQTCIALKNCDGYELLIGVLKDINSELKTN